MAGTSIATVNAVYFLSTGIVANLIEGVTYYHITIGQNWSRLIIALFLLASTAVI